MTSVYERIAQREWFYDFDLPNGELTRCRKPDFVMPTHGTKLRMMSSVLEPYVLSRGHPWGQLTAVDLGCHQGYFASHLARRGLADVLGIDARPEHIADAELIREVYGLPNLRFLAQDVVTIEPSALGKFNIVLCFGLLYHVENPIGLLRLCRDLCDGVCLVETQVGPNVTGDIDWGSNRWKKRIVGAFTVIDESDTLKNPESSVTGISLVPSPEALLWTMKAAGFARVALVPPPPGAYEQHASGRRVIAVGYT